MTPPTARESFRDIGPILGLTAVVLVLALASWRWYVHVTRPKGGEPTHQAWEQVREAYPPSFPAHEPPAVLAQVTDPILRANPFSPQRRFVPPAAGTTAGTGLVVPPKPQFVYKGQIRVGPKQRAIVENTATAKTHFLEVGQEVAGFKVLDISPTRVLLSDVQTQKELVVTLVSQPTREAEGVAQ